MRGHTVEEQARVMGSQYLRQVLSSIGLGGVGGLLALQLLDLRAFGLLLIVLLRSRIVVLRVSDLLA